MRQTNPSLQCSVCGQWKRLVDKETGMQRFYSCCFYEGIEIVHTKQICTDCCEAGCPDKAAYLSEPQPGKPEPEANHVGTFHFDDTDTGSGTFAHQAKVISGQPEGQG